MSDEAPPPLLLHSLAEFRSLILPILDAVAPKRIVEIGGEGGQLTELLATWAVEHGATVACVDPVPSQYLRRLDGEGPVRLVEAKSPDVLEEIGPFDLYVVDGDHNYHVVSGELSAIFGDHEGPAPVALLHDVAWPAARRDQYYDPADVPQGARWPYDYQRGAVPGEPELQADRGFHGAGAFAYAVDEGGSANGVLTAVEDLLADRPELELRRVPCIFGFGAIYAADAPWADAIRAALDPFHENELLARMEANRLELYVEVIDRRRRLDVLERERRGLLDGLERELEAERAAGARLRLQLAGREPTTG